MKLYQKILTATLVLAVMGSSTDYKVYSQEDDKVEMKLPSAPGTKTKKTALIELDYSNVNEGYFQVKTLSDQHKKLKVQVFKGSEDKSPYKYDINKNLAYETIPLTKGNGDYIVKVYENTTGNKYAVLMTVNFTVTLSDEKKPFLYPNQVVDYNAESKTIEKARELTKGQTSELERIKNIYGYVINNVKYDWDKVKAVQGKYVLPVVDTTLATNKGICFDYAALSAAMMRSHGIPTKVVTGYVDEGYHAWIEVYASEIGWISPKRYFNSDQWNFSDPTYDASSSNYQGSYQVKYNY